MMTASDIRKIAETTHSYNFHSHTQFCDARAPMADIAAEAARQGFEAWGFSPHSPVPIESPCNMKREQVGEYLAEAMNLREIYADRMQILAGMEIDFLSPDFGPHIDYFHHLGLDYRIGSVHFVPNQDGILLDCDGKFERFAGYLRDGYRSDLRYVVERYFEQVLLMIERGGFEILGHFDKILGNASVADPEIENQHWVQSLVDDVISHAHSSELIVEINTKSLADKHRFFPAQASWRKILEAGIPIVVNSDAHFPEKVNAGRPEAFEILAAINNH